MRRNAVDQGVKERKDDVGGQFRPLRHRPGHDGGRRGGEGHLKDKRGEDDAHLVVCGVHEEIADSTERVAVVAGSEAETETEHPVG